MALLHWSCLAGTEQGQSKLAVYLSLSMRGLGIVPLLSGAVLGSLCGHQLGWGDTVGFTDPALWACINSGKA